MSEPSRTSHFELVGGQLVVDRLVEAFYRHMSTLPEATGIRAMHPPDLSNSQRVLKEYLSEWLGGPKEYSSKRGHPRLRMRHMPFRIGTAERDAWMACMQRAMHEVLDDPGLRELLLQRLYKLADWLRNEGNAPHSA